MNAVQNASGQLDVLKQVYPDLLRLAQIVSLAARVEPQLVRQARLALLPWAEAGLEADLWFSSLVQARSTLALVLQPELLPDLRRGLAGDQELLRRAWSEVLTQIHPMGQTPPLILLDEELVYQGLLENDPAAAPRIAELLKQAMKTMKDDKERGPALARWALRTYRRLPDRVKQSQDGSNFQAFAAYTAGGFGTSTLQGTDSASAGQITIATTDPVDIWVRLLDTGLELSRAQLDGGNPIPTQRFDTIWVEVGWGEGSDARAQAVIVPPSGSVRVAAPPDVFRIRMVAGDVYTLRALGDPVTRTPPAVLHALLIGIDAYPSHFPALQGCVNDVAAMMGVLTDPAGIGLPPEQVRIIPLVTPTAPPAPSLAQALPATRANLLATLRELGEPEVHAGDRVLVYFAGYGTQVTQGGSAQDALVTSDGQLVYAAELDELLVAIAARTDDVTVILDCGFSAGGRLEEIADDRLSARSLARAVALDLPSTTSPPVGSGRILQGAVTSRISLLAARPHEPAYEIAATSTPNGVLTAALTAILHAVEPTQRPTLRWADILPELLDRVMTQVPAQHPLLAGYQERHVFGGPWTRRDPGFAVRPNADRSFQIAAGSLMGVTEGAIIAVYGPNPAVFPQLGSQDDLAVRMGELRVVHAARSTAVAQPVSSAAPLTLPTGARGRIAQPGLGERLRVRVDPSDLAIAEMLERSPVLHVTSAPSEVEVTVRGSSDQGWTISNDVEPEVARVRPDQRYVLQTALEAYALYNTVLRLAAGSNDSELAGALDVTLLDANDPQTLDRIAAGPAQTAQALANTLPEAPRDERGIFRLPPEFRSCVRVSNMSAYKLFFTVLNCTNNGQVEYLGDETAAPGESVVVWLDNRIGRPFAASLGRQSSNRQIDRMVVVATTDRDIDMRFLAVDRSVQEVIDEVSGTRRGRVAQVEAPRSGIGTAELWTAVTVPCLIEEAPVAPTQPPAVGFKAGKTVETTGFVNLRGTPGYVKKLADDVLMSLPPETLAIIAAGPRSADGLTWWQIRGTVNGRAFDGWAAEKSPTGQTLLVPPVEPRHIKILFVPANPLDTDALKLDEEVRAVDLALRQGTFRDRFDLRSHWAVRYSDLQELFLRHRPDIVHFSGHGSDTSEIILQDDTGVSHPISLRALSRLFSPLKDNIRCVVLNACYSETQAQAIAQHIDAVVGMTTAIGDEAAINFATAFYQGLGFGLNVKTAFDLGCNQIDLANLNEQDAPKLLHAPTSDPAQLVFIKAA